MQQDLGNSFDVLFSDKNKLNCYFFFFFKKHSLMKPGARIYPHSDTTGAEFGNLAFHLGLDVPPIEQVFLVICVENMFRFIIGSFLNYCY
jgi:hypothetical protein